MYFELKIPERSSVKLSIVFDAIFLPLALVYISDIIQRVIFISVQTEITCCFVRRFRESTGGVSRSGEMTSSSDPFVAK